MLLLNYPSLRGIFFFLRNYMHIQNKDITRMIEENPLLIFQNMNENIRKKVVLLEKNGIPRIIQKGIMKKLPQFYLKYFSNAKAKKDH